MNHCCTCAGVCYHVGPATFCAAHDTTVRALVAPLPVERSCEHCWCHTEIRYGKRHQVCCNCGTARLDGGGA
ncbi:MAG: hypothetical protein M0Z46_12800 [Actinomycetota bacterium]|jgi:hypothetical protein|nr:hypothetical protein [Actinomycetota bacterium]